MAMMVSAWEEVLAPVPTDYLNRCYVEAARRHATDFPISAGELFAVWEENCEKWTAEVVSLTPKGKYCAPCSGTGWEPVFADEEQKKSLGVHPCRHCRPEAHAAWFMTITTTVPGARRLSPRSNDRSSTNQ